jgi:hypothetical protein
VKPILDCIRPAARYFNGLARRPATFGIAIFLVRYTDTAGRRVRAITIAIFLESYMNIAGRRVRAITTAFAPSAQPLTVPKMARQTIVSFIVPG